LFLGLSNKPKCCLFLWCSRVTVVVFISPITSWCVHTSAHTLASNYQLFSQFEPNLMQM
jgi:hypothetical protein